VSCRDGELIRRLCYCYCCDDCRDLFLRRNSCQRRKIVRRRRRRRRNVFFMYMLLQADYAKALQFEAGLEEDIRELQIILRTLGNTIGTPTFVVEFRRPFASMHFLTDRMAMPDSKFKGEYRIERENFIYLNDALQLPQEIRTANRLCFDSRDALMTFLRRLGESSRQSTVGDLTGRDRSSVSRIVKFVASMIVAKWWAALLLDPHRLTRARLAQYARAIEADGCPNDKPASLTAVAIAYSGTATLRSRQPATARNTNKSSVSSRGCARWDPRLNLAPTPDCYSV
jgi:hypothetical protein